MAANLPREGKLDENRARQSTIIERCYGSMISWGFTLSSSFLGVCGRCWHSWELEFISNKHYVVLAVHSKAVIEGSAHTALCLQPRERRRATNLEVIARRSDKRPPIGASLKKWKSIASWNRYFGGHRYTTHAGNPM